jgi:hypothetical protein
VTENLIFSRKKVLYSRCGGCSSVVEQRIVVPLAVGSIPIIRPIKKHIEIYLDIFF